MTSSTVEGSQSGGVVLGRRALNRALLARQMLLERQEMPVAGAIEHLVGMQAQEPPNPYVALWSRLTDFDTDELSQMIVDRSAVRVPLMRTTLHLVTAQDCLTLSPLMSSVLDRTLRSTPYGKGTADMDREELLAAGRVILDEQPRTKTELGALLHERWPDREPLHLAYTIHYLLPLVQIPPRGVWGASHQATWTTVEQWLGRPLDPEPSVDDVVLRYLAAFGPATSSDIRTWSGLNGLPEVLDRLRPELVMYRDESGRDLFDLPDALLPDPDTPAPPRFLPEFDNVLLSHADRTRIVSEQDRKRLQTPNFVGPGTFLVDGFVRGIWKTERVDDDVTLLLHPLEPGREPLSNTDRQALEEEGWRLLAFLAPDAGSYDIRFATH